MARTKLPKCVSLMHPGETRLFREVVDFGSVEAVAAQHGLAKDVVEAAVQVVFRFLGVDNLSDAQAKLSARPRRSSRPRD